ncbi:hypothetical protein KIPB_008240 [Kipferlia bialata]|uniref:Uncharacterized protein n=1 Tax=Kipferlia bialata TaxID=797122 RepID=A0A9K3D1K6_9EUKA|nr:hypothetical protein KIPB_008240 [Kipferlia bialata]|eukprot:g8240.t1
MTVGGVPQSMVLHDSLSHAVECCRLCHTLCQASASNDIAFGRAGVRPPAMPCSPYQLAHLYPRAALVPRLINRGLHAVASHACQTLQLGLGPVLIDWVRLVVETSSGLLKGGLGEERERERERDKGGLVGIYRSRLSGVRGSDGDDDGEPDPRASLSPEGVAFVQSLQVKLALARTLPVPVDTLAMLSVVYEKGGPALAVILLSLLQRIGVRVRARVLATLAKHTGADTERAQLVNEIVSTTVGNARPDLLLGVTHQGELARYVVNPLHVDAEDMYADEAAGTISSRLPRLWSGADPARYMALVEGEGEEDRERGRDRERAGDRDRDSGDQRLCPFSTLYTLYHDARLRQACGVYQAGVSAHTHTADTSASDAVAQALGDVDRACVAVQDHHAQTPLPSVLTSGLGDILSQETSGCRSLVSYQKGLEKKFRLPLIGLSAAATLRVLVKNGLDNPELFETEAKRCVKVAGLRPSVAAAVHLSVYTSASIDRHRAAGRVFQYAKANRSSVSVAPFIEALLALRDVSNADRLMQYVKEGYDKDVLRGSIVEAAQRK